MAGKQGRQKKNCPVPDCDSRVVHLPRHLETVHHWKPEKARNAVSCYGLRKTSAATTKQLKQHGCKPDTVCTSGKLCPIENCSRLVKRLSPHLQTFHHIDRKSALFRSMLKLARLRGRANAQVLTDTNCDLESLEDEDWASSADVLETSDQSLFSESSDEASCEYLMPSTEIHDTSGDTMADTSLEMFGPVPLVHPGVIPQSDTVAQSSELPTDFLQFRTWLQTPDGGRKCEKSAKQHAFQMGVIFEAVNTSTLNMHTVKLLWCKKLLVKFLTVYAVEKQFLPGTIKSYLSSLRHWYSYILSEEADRLSTEEKQQIQQTRDRVSRWTASYRKDSAARSLQKMDDDISKLITPKKVDLFDRSELALAAIKLLGIVADGQVQNISMTQYVTVRDFILTQIVLTNANRSGVLANMTFEEFQGARQVDGNYLVSVVHHKTAFMYGPAKIVLSPQLFSWMSLFVKCVRSLITCRVTGRAKYVFLSWTGEGLDSSQITRAVQAAWKKAGLGQEITCTLMRKSAVSAVHQRCPEQNANLADLMCHTTQTASKSYRLVHRQQTAVSASMTLTQLMKNGAAASVVQGGQCVDEEHHSVDPAKLQVKTKIVWTPELLQNIRTIFMDAIESKVVDLATVKEKCKESRLLADIDPRKIYDRLRQECSKDTMLSEGDEHAALIIPVDSESVADCINRISSDEHRSLDLDGSESKVIEDTVNDVVSDDDSEIIGPSVKPAKSLFSQSDASTIQEVCKHIIKSGPISQRRIAEAIENANFDATSVMKRYTIPQIISRVKYERRKQKSDVPKYFVRL